jgi:hypothetical protein
LASAGPLASFVLGGVNSLFDRLGICLSLGAFSKPPYLVRERAASRVCAGFLPMIREAGVEDLYPPDLAEEEPITFGVRVRDGMAEAVAVWIGMTLDDGEPIGRPHPDPFAHTGPPVEERRERKARFMQAN